MGWALLGSLSTGLSFCCQQKGRCLRPGRACPSSLSRQERDGKLELIRLKTIPAVGTNQGTENPSRANAQLEAEGCRRDRRLLQELFSERLAPNLKPHPRSQTEM